MPTILLVSGGSFPKMAKCIRKKRKWLQNLPPQVMEFIDEDLSVNRLMKPAMQKKRFTKKQMY